MKERPILFSAPMVRAILEGRKTQTRRVVKPQPKLIKLIDGTHSFAVQKSKGIYNGLGMFEMLETCPYGKIGDQLWVKETWRTWASLDNVKPSNLENGIIRDFAAGGNSVGASMVCDLSKKWRSPLFMQKRFSRIQLEITNIGIERLQDINEEDAISEGMTEAVANAIFNVDELSVFASSFILTPHATNRIFFESLWEKINGADSWAQNPWVWVIEFKRV